VGNHTTALIQLDDGRMVNLQLDRDGPQHLDHGYAVTVFGAQGGTVDSVIPFNYVKPGNEKNALESITGVKLTGTQFRQWNSELSDYERDYTSKVKIREHAGELGFTMVLDRKTGEAKKGVAVTFHNGPAMIADEPTRTQMREAGMYWSGNTRSWVTPAANEMARQLMDRHPLKNPEYIAQFNKEFAAPEKKPDLAPKTGPGAVQAEIDTSAEAAQFGRATYNAFNVALTRAKYQAVVFTNSVPGLKKAVLSVDEKTSTIGSETARKMEGYSEKLDRDTALPIQEKATGKPQIRVLKQKDPGRELKR